MVTDNQGKPLWLGGVDSGADSLSAQNTFGTGVRVRGIFAFSVSGTFPGTTVSLQRSLDRYSVATDALAAWTTIYDDLDAACEWCDFEPSADVYWRLGVVTGDYVAGPVVVRITQ